MKTKNNLKPLFSCCVTPGYGFHEVGCDDKQWTKKELEKAIKCAEVSSDKIKLKYLINKYKQL